MDDTARHLLDLVARGRTYDAALELAGLFIEVGEHSRYTRHELARHLVALCSNRHGSFNWATDTLDLVEEWREAAGQPARRVPTETTVRRHLRSFEVVDDDGEATYAPAQVEDLVNGLLRRLFAIAVARGELRDGYDLVIDETAFPYYGQGRSGASRKPRERDGEVLRERLRTEASIQAMPMPPEKFHATMKGFPFQVIGARFASKRTVPLAYVRRRLGVAESNESAVGLLLAATRDLPAPRWILMDKGYASSDTVRLVGETIRANGWHGTRFLVPVAKRTEDVQRTIPKTQRVSKPGQLARTKPRQKSKEQRNLGTIAQGLYARSVPVSRGPDGNRFAVVRDWQTSGADLRGRSNVLFYYRPRHVDGEWVMDWDEPGGRSWIGFYTNADPTPETAYAITQAYSARWGIEILNKRDHGFMGLSKAQTMRPRDITYGLGLLLSALEHAERTHVLMVRRARAQDTRRGRRRVVRTHEVLGSFDLRARGLVP